jgi:hypothetical protein
VLRLKVKLAIKKYQCISIITFVFHELFINIFNAPLNDYRSQVWLSYALWFFRPKVEDVEKKTFYDSVVRFVESADRN